MKQFRLLPILLAGYLFLLIFRPYEYWPILGEFRVERVYMLCFMLVVLLSKDKHFIPNPLNGAIFLFAFVLLISGIFSLSWDASWKMIEEYLKFTVFYFMIILCVRDEKDFRFIVLAFIGVMFFYVGKSAWEFFVNGRHTYRMEMARMIGIDLTYGDPNSFAATICYSLPVFWAMIRFQFKNKWLRFALWSYGLLALVSIVMTGSRSGMVTAIFFFIIVLLTTSRKFIGIILIAAMLIVAWHVMPDVLQTRFLSTFYQDVGPESAQQSASGRMHGFLHGVEIFLQNPVLGVGPGNYPLSWDSRMYSHNLYGQILGELGILGVTSFLFFILILFYCNIKICKKFKYIFNFSNCNNNLSVDDKIIFTNMHRSLFFYYLIAQSILFTLMLMFFKGWSDHNLYRYTWLWLAALTVLGHHLFYQEVKSLERS